MDNGHFQAGLLLSLVATCPLVQTSSYPACRMVGLEEQAGASCFVASALAIMIAVAVARTYCTEFDAVVLGATREDGTWVVSILIVRDDKLDMEDDKVVSSEVADRPSDRQGLTPMGHGRRALTSKMLDIAGDRKTREPANGCPSVVCPVGTRRQFAVCGQLARPADDS
ncbi:hypothetical protein BC826DRAFT_969645 [Russula brevipes]|nr:hypothetical protein BC826DRAFT_969645 [Russula brevipes]